MQLASDSIAYSVSAKRPDGSRAYGDAWNQQWIDSLHTGHKLIALRDPGSTQRPRLRPCYSALLRRVLGQARLLRVPQDALGDRQDPVPSLGRSMGVPGAGIRRCGRGFRGQTVTRSVLVVSDYAANYPGAYIRSLELLGREVAGNGSVAYLFPKERAWHEILRPLGPVFVSDGFLGGRVSKTLTQDMLAICRAHRVSLIHTSFGLAAPVSATVARRVLGVAHLWHWRNPPSSLADVREQRGVLRAVAPAIYRALGSGHGIANIAISSDLAETLVAQACVSPGKIRVVHNGIDLGLFEDCGPCLDRRIGDAIGVDLAARPVIGFVGHFGPQKDHETFLRAVALVKRRVPDVAVLLVGGALTSQSGERGGLLLDRIAQLELEGNVWLLGQHDPIAPVMQLFDVGVLSSNWEGLGNVIMEYMAMCKPVVATRVGGIPDVVIDGETGFLVSPKSPNEMADRLQELILNPGLRERMGVAGRRRIEEAFSLDRWVRSILDVYSELGS
jgi:glycosyltransferase involved in cell wall biosynthesis